MYNIIPSRFHPISYVLIGILIGIILSQIFIKHKPVETLYISELEVLELEKNRVSSFPNNESKHLFYGKPAIAADLIEQVGMSYASDKANVVFSNDKVYGSNVRSISKEVYEQAIEELMKNEEN